MQFDGDWYDGNGSARTPVRVRCGDHGALIIEHRDDHRLIRHVAAAEVTVSPRLAGCSRLLELAEGQSIETLANDAVDRWQRRHRPAFAQGLVHRLESRWRWVLLTLVLVVATFWGTLRYGVPFAAEKIAAALPAELLDHPAQQTLAMLDQYMLEPSALSPERQQQLQAYFAPVVGRDPALRIRVLFRDGGLVGANAFALPDGQVVFTDAMVALAEHDEELLAVLGHEIGHVANRHSMRRVVQGSLYTFALAMITGDPSGTGEVLVALPALLVDLAYSRAHETEADGYALALLRELHVPPRRFADLMQRLEATRGADEEEEKQTEEGVRWRTYLSSHPATDERIKPFL